jgi:hypothetical protein
MSRILDMQRPQSSTDSCLLAAITNHLLNMIMSQVMLINRSRLATYANHAIVTHAVYEITFCHDYKIVNAIQVYTIQTITILVFYVWTQRTIFHPYLRISWRFESIVNLTREITWQNDTWEPRRQMSCHLSLWLSKSRVGLYLALVPSSMQKPQGVVRGWLEHYPF